MKYLHIKPLKINYIKKLLQSKETEDVCRAIVTCCMYCSDYDFIIKTCKSFSEHINNDVRRNVLTGLTTIALNFKKLDKELANEVIKNALNDKDEEIRGIAEDVIEDLKHNLKNFKLI